MRRAAQRFPASVALTLLVWVWGAPSAPADHEEALHSANASEIARRPLKLPGGVLARGTDMAFEGSLLVVGSYSGVAFFRILPEAPFLRKLSFYDCPGQQADVSVWRGYVFVSIDYANTNNKRTPICNNTDDSLGKEGIRIIDASDPRRPRQVRFVETICGSHTNTLVPRRRSAYLYATSYPVEDATPGCNALTRQISVIKFLHRSPGAAKVVATPGVTSNPGCHDITVFPARKIAVAACITQSEVWNISDPKAPVRLSTIVNSEIDAHHSASFTWDGRYVVIGDEFGAGIAEGCTGDADSPKAAMWFYDITEPTAPEVVGHHALPRQHPPPDTADEAVRVRCTTHNFNVIPMKDRDRYMAVSSYYSGGVSVVDFSEPSSPVETAHYLPMDGGALPDMWSAYWYNGRIYASESKSLLGVRAVVVKGTGRHAARFFRQRLNPQVHDRP